MSKVETQPEEIVNDEELSEEPSDEEELSDEDLAEFEGDEGEYVTTEALLSSTLMTEDGDTVCSALVNIARQLEMQNKIMVKLVTAIQKRA